MNGINDNVPADPRAAAAARARGEALRRLAGFAAGVDITTQRVLDLQWPDLGAAVAHARIYARLTGDERDSKGDKG